MAETQITETQITAKGFWDVVMAEIQQRIAAREAAPKRPNYFGVIYFEDRALPFKSAIEFFAMRAFCEKQGIPCRCYHTAMESVGGSHSEPSAAVAWDHHNFFRGVPLPEAA